MISFKQFRYLKYDLYRYFYPNDEISKVSLLTKLKIIIFTQAIWAIVTYRFLRWVIFECNIPLVNKLLFWLGSIFELIIQTLTGINIAADCDVGPGLYVGHFGNIFLPSGVKIGKYCNISHENTLGIAGRGVNRGVPEIGDYVYIGSGAKVIGKIKIGNNVAIGANAVVTRDVPDNAVVAGVPAKILNYNSSIDFIEFNKSKNIEMLDG